MSERLNKFVRSYEADFKFQYDNEIMLNWYSKRIEELTYKDSRVLELGIGHGYTCNNFSEYFKEYVVIEGSNSVIQKFRRQFPKSKAKIFHSYFEEFYSEAKFDVIIMGFVLEHVDDPVKILDLFKGFLAPQGRCFVSVPNAESLHRRFGYEAGLLSDMTVLGEGDLSLGHQRLYTASSLTEQLQACGYIVIRKEGIFLKPLSTDQLRSLGLSKDILNGMCKVGIAYPELSAGMLFEAKDSR